MSGSKQSSACRGGAWQKDFMLVQILRQAVQAYVRGDLRAAETFSLRALARHPNQPDALNILGLTAYRSRQHSKARDLLERAIKIDPGNADYHANLGLVLAAQGRLDEAVPSLQAALRLRPDHADARHTLGNVLYLKRDFPAAIAELERSLQRNPNNPSAIHTLGNALLAMDRTDDAIAAFRRAIAMQPGLAQAHLDLGIALRRRGDAPAAAKAISDAIRIRPDLPDAYVHLAQFFTGERRHADAISALRQGAQRNPKSAELQLALGNTLREQSELEQAQRCYRTAIELEPLRPEAYINLGSLLRTRGQLAEARSVLSCAVELNPSSAEAYNNLGNILRDQSSFDEAESAYRSALRIAPGMPRALSNLGCVLKDRGELDEALNCFRQAIAREPDFVEAHCNYLYTIQFHPDYDSRRIRDEHAEWGRRFGTPLRPTLTNHTNERNPDRRIRVGYVSPDFHEHAVGRFLLPLLRHHDHQRHEVICYSDTQTPDHVTDQIRARSDRWNHTAALADDELADLVRAQGVDVLVDLTLHMANNRLLSFAHKPAPVQVTWLGYAGTTGLDAMDYRLTDPHLDPPGVNDGDYCERSIHLPQSYWCYEAPQCAGEVEPLPATEAGYVTFGCLNNFCKVSNQTLGMWVRLLQSVPDSRMILHAHMGSHRLRFNRMLAAEGIDPHRIIFMGVKPLREYLDTYAQAIDIALDPFPYNGGTTTCDALWMGVPVVTLAGQRAVSRAGVSLLTNVGLPELIAQSPEQYVAIARGLARDLPRLGQLRATLRSQMQNSPLMDAPRFARDIENAYRTMWQVFCATA
jgi:predicted O-linked N-acetylglucosamine transferase (SPINDLY family)